MNYSEKKKNLLCCTKDWELKTLKNLVEIKSGASPINFDFRDDGKIPFFKVNDMNFCNKYLNDASYYFNKCKFPLMKKGMIVFPKRGAAIFTDKIAILVEDCFFDTNIMGLKVNSSVLNEFLYYHLSYQKLCKIADTSSVPQINNKHIEPLKISIPPILEQKKIASILSTVDEQIENTENLINSYFLLKKGLMQTLLTKGIGHTEFKETAIGRIPIDWIVVKLENVISEVSSGIWGQSPVNNLKSFPVIRSTEITFNGKINVSSVAYRHIPKEKIKKYTLFNGDILIVSSSGSAKLLGRAALFQRDDENIYLYSNFILRLRPNKNVNPYFLYYFLNSSKYDNFLKQFQQTTTGLRNLSKNELINIKLPLPSIKEQEEITGILNFNDECIKNYMLKKRKLNLLKKGLMQQLLTGKIRVKV